MLEVAEVGPSDVVHDLGCGDARILISAVKEFNAKKAVGYEIRKDICKAALSRVENEGLMDRVKVVNDDLFKADLSEATVITLYLTSFVNEQLKQKFEREVRSGTRIICHDFEIRGWQERRRVTFHDDTIYLYLVPEAFNWKTKKL